MGGNTGLRGGILLRMLCALAAKEKGISGQCAVQTISEMTPDTEGAESCEGAVYLGTIEGERQPSWLVNICVGPSELTFNE